MRTPEIPEDTLGRLLVGKATEGDQMLAYNALATPQPSDPAEGDAHEKLADILYSIGWQPSNDAQLKNLRKAMPDIAALSTPPTAAVVAPGVSSTQIAKVIQRGLDSWPRWSAIKIAHEIGALTAALDPQVKKQD